MNTVHRSFKQAKLIVPLFLRRTRGRPSCVWSSGSTRWCRRTWPPSCTRPPARTSSPRRRRRRCSLTCSTLLRWDCKSEFHDHCNPSKSIKMRGSKFKFVKVPEHICEIPMYALYGKVIKISSSFPFSIYKNLLSYF